MCSPRCDEYGPEAQLGHHRAHLGSHLVRAIGCSTRRGTFALEVAPVHGCEVSGDGNSEHRPGKSVRGTPHDSSVENERMVAETGGRNPLVGGYQRYVCRWAHERKPATRCDQRSCREGHLEVAPRQLACTGRMVEVKQSTASVVETDAIMVISVPEEIVRQNMGGLLTWTC